MTTYLLLGASGFLGSQFHDVIDQSADAPRVVAVSNHPPKPRTGKPCTWQQMDLARSSVRDFEWLLKWSKPDAIFNCVGRTGGTPDQLQAANVTVVDNLVRALSQSNEVPLVHLGSAAEYGIQPEGVPIRETALARPISHYGRTKLAGTELVAEGVDRGAIKATVLRVFNPVGPRAPANSLVGTAAREIRQALLTEEQSITLGPLWPHRDFLASVDVVTAALLAIGRADTYPVLNVGRGVAMSCRSMVELLADAAGFEGDVFETTSGSQRSQSVPWQQANICLLRNHLQWVPTTSIAEAVAGLWQAGG